MDFDFNSGIEDNAGSLAALGGMAHLSNQSAQRRTLAEQTELLKEQLESAKNAAKSAKAVEEIEKQRLEIEQKRFQLEQNEKDLAHQRKIQLKSVRKIMAEVNRELDDLC